MEDIYKTIPNFYQFFIPTLQALQFLGGSGSNEEINEKVYEIAELNDKILAIPHKKDGLQSEVDYRIAWARTYLKKYGLVENSFRGVWALKDNDIDPESYDTDIILRTVRGMHVKPQDMDFTDSCRQKGVIEEEENGSEWKEELLQVLQAMDPFAFERLCQRLLRESGFIQVEVTKKSGDGGIDGKGIARVNGLLSFHVFFQCKRFKGSVASSYIRDFRGAMQGRADKGLFITTGKFTQDAIKEASRDGAHPVDLINGDMLCEKLKELCLGVKTKTIEQVTVHPEWFDKL